MMQPRHNPDTQTNSTATTTTTVPNSATTTEQQQKARPPTRTEPWPHNFPSAHHSSQTGMETMHNLRQPLTPANPRYPLQTPANPR